MSMSIALSSYPFEFWSFERRWPKRSAIINRSCARKISYRFHGELYDVHNENGTCREHSQEFHRVHPPREDHLIRIKLHNTLLSSWNDLSIRFAMIETVRRTVHKAKSESISGIYWCLSIVNQLSVREHDFLFSTHFTYSAKSAFRAKDTRWYILIGTGISRVPRRVVHDHPLGLNGAVVLFLRTS